MFQKKYFGFTYVYIFIPLWDQPDYDGLNNLKIQKVNVVLFGWLQIFLRNSIVY